MSSIDNAFIKAYGKGRVPRAAQPASQSDTAPPLSAADGATYRVDSAEPVAAAPHARFPAAAPKLQRTEEKAAQHAASATTSAQVAETVPMPSPPLESWMCEPLIIMPAAFETPATLPMPEPAPEPSLAPHTPAPPAPQREVAVPSTPPAALASIEAAGMATPATGLTAVWEVDAFCWPEICDRLEAAPDECLQDAGRQLVAASRQGLKLLAVTSCRRGEGRTTLALSLARSAAAYGARVAVLDGDWRNPQLANQLGVEATGGWQDALEGNLSLADIAITSLEDNVTLLPLTSVPGAHDLPLNDGQVARLLATATRHFDLVIVDMEPMDLFPPPLVPRRPLGIDAAIVVQDVRVRSASDVHRCVVWLREAGVQSVGIAENFAPRA